MVSFFFHIRIQTYHVASLSLEFSMNGYTWQKYAESGSGKVSVLNKMKYLLVSFLSELLCSSNAS